MEENLNKKTRLHKVVKELGINAITIVDFLAKHGYAVENNPNLWISAKQYAMIISEFGSESQNNSESHISSVTNRRKDNIDKQEDIIKNIWRIHTSIQEQLLYARAVPIIILPDTIRMVGGDKLILSVDERKNTNSVLNKIGETFGVPYEDLETALNDGYFFANGTNARNIDCSEKQRVVEYAEHNFIKLSCNPIIDGVIRQRNSSFNNLSNIMYQNRISYSFDNKKRLQISIDDLKKIKQITNQQKCDVFFPKNANAIFPVRPNPVFFLKRMFPNIEWGHYTNIVKDREKQGNMYFEKRIVLNNGYLPEETLKQLSTLFGVELYCYTFIFEINPSVVSKYNPKESSYILPKIDEDGKTFRFVCRILNNSPQEGYVGYYKEQFDFNLKFTRLNKFFTEYFGKENVNFKCSFEYHYNSRQFYQEFLPKQNDWENDFWEDISKSFWSSGISVSRNSETIGIDFEWEKESMTDIMNKIHQCCPCITLSFFENHKCNVDFTVKNVSLNELENTLHDSFPSIQTERNDKEGTLYFMQEYTDALQYNRIKDSIKHELDSLNLAQYSNQMFDNPEGKEKYSIKLDNISMQESLSDTIKDLRGYEFEVDDINFGKLIRINYPQLTFDISFADLDKIREVIANNQVKSIRPNLTGDLEKIARLKKSFDAIISGKGLQNPNLSEFIFDASKAKPINDIDEFYLDSRSEYYNDITNNLLNNKINESQKQAIIKTLKAEDLSLIQGPPGTGKSTAIAEIIWQHIRLNPQERILLTSETNLAVDNAIDRIVNSSHNLVKPIRIADEEKLESEGRQFNLEVMKQWVENGELSTDDLDNESEEENIVAQKVILQNWMDNIKCRINKDHLSDNVSCLWENMLSNPSKETRQVFFDVYKRNCNVIGATCSSIGEKNTKGAPTGFFRSYSELFGSVEKRTNREGKEIRIYKGKINFDTVIQDESSKATPAELSLPLIYGKKNIIIGDHRQLPPLLDKEEFVSSLNYLLDRTEDKEQRNDIINLKRYVIQHFEEMEISHFQRLFEGIDSSLKGVFNQQFRMHPAINEVIKQFYIEDGGLMCGLDSTQVETPDFANPQSRYHGLNIDGFISPNDHVLWIDTRTPELLDGTSRVNYGEIEAVRKVLSKFDKSDSFQQYMSHWNTNEDKQIGLISFYGKQIKQLRSIGKEFKNILIRVSTVDRFQGMERNIIIVSMVRSNCIATDKDQRPDYELYGALGYPEQNDLGFAQSPNRLNVALSRAKRLLIIVGNSELFRTKNIYNNVYECIANNPNGRIIKYEEL